VEYERQRETGLENQCWKDSWNSILFADGTLASLPRATCEIQGYVYDARLRSARLARLVWDDPDLADRLEAQAAELKRRFNQDFWLEDRQFFALALDGSKRRVDSLTSNIGHLLWSGIVDDDKAAAVVQHVMGERLFTGWGVRTMAAGDGGYNPIGYHVGTIWPHDTALIALGLRRYGYAEDASRLALGILQAATYFDGRLPEAFAGYTRSEIGFPVEYPTACSPQAWASGAPLMLLRVLLGMEPAGRELRTEPVLPESISSLTVHGIPWRGRRIDVGTSAVPAPPVGTQLVPAAESARELFATLDERLDASGLAGLRASCRFDVEDAGSWRVLVTDGAIRVTESHDPAETVLRMTEATLLRLTRGEENPMTAVLTGRLEVEGDLAHGEQVVRALCHL
jgi:putative sterol carrier protein